MPKTSNEGPSYAGLVDVSSADTVTPEWAPAEVVVAEPADVSRETQAAADTDDKAADPAGEAPKSAARKTKR